MKRLIVGNWKMNPATLKEAKRLFERLRRGAARTSRMETVIAPPSVYIAPLKATAAQDLSAQSMGAHTGELSGEMLYALGVRYVIVGHSERRAMGESVDTINKKVRFALLAGLTPILCVGEKSRDDHGHYLHEVKEMLRSALRGVLRKDIARVVVAYEPVWAVGKEARGVLPPEEALHMNLFIRKVLADLGGDEAAKRARVLYGGSVDAENALPFFTVGKMDGLLVGRESLNPEKFIALIKHGNSLR